MTSLHSLFIMKNIVDCVHSVPVVHSLLNLLFVVHCLLVLNNFFIVNSLHVAYEVACWAYVPYSL